MNQPLKRAYKHWYQDGLGEIVQSLIFLVLGLYYVMLGRVQSGEIESLVLPLIGPLVIIGLVLFSRKLLEWLKTRFTYPRVGYVAFRRESDTIRKRFFIRVGIGIIAALIVEITAMLLSGTSFSWAVFTLTLAFVAIYIYAGMRVHEIRMYVSAGTAMIIGSVLAFMGFDGAGAMGLFFLYFSGVTFLMGVITFIRFIRRNPVVDLDDEEVPDA